MINDVFDNVGPGIGCALYVDDGAIWKRVQNFLPVIYFMQATIKKVEWTFDWRFKMSTSKSC